MEYQTQNFNHLIGTPGFSDELLKNHFKLYEGYVANTNKVMGLIKTLSIARKHDTPEFSELKRRLGWEFNGMRLHELYFENLTKESQEPNADLPIVQNLIETYGDFGNWERYFKATGSLRGIGWAVMYWDSIGQRTLSMWINEHDIGHPAGCTPLLVMDVFEHAFLTDYGLKRTDYIDAFMKAIYWEEINRRFEAVK